MELKLNAKEILDKAFTKNVKGYNALEVDEFLDIIIKDYQRVQRYTREMNILNQALEKEVNKLKSEVKNLELDNARLNSITKNIKADDEVSVSNIDLIKRINYLEELCYSNGISPNKN